MYHQIDIRCHPLNTSHSQQCRKKNCENNHIKLCILLTNFSFVYTETFILSKTDTKTLLRRLQWMPMIFYSPVLSLCVGQSESKVIFVIKKKCTMVNPRLIMQHVRNIVKINKIYKVSMQLLCNSFSRMQGNSIKIVWLVPPSTLLHYKSYSIKTTFKTLHLFSISSF